MKLISLCFYSQSNLPQTFVTYFKYIYETSSSPHSSRMSENKVFYLHLDIYTNMYDSKNLLNLYWIKNLELNVH